MKTANPSRSRQSEAGMGLIAVMGIMVLFAVALLAVAPSVQLEVQREKELEAVRRGEEIAEAIRVYVDYHRGSKLPESIDDLLEGIPQGTKKRMILRPSAATDPLSEDGKWRLIKPEPTTISAFAKRVQAYNNGLLPNNPSRTLDRFSIQLLVNLNTGTEDESDIVDDDFDVTTDNQPFIGVASQSRSKSVIHYYGIEKHSNWIFTPLFRGSGTRITGQAPPPPPRPVPPPNL
ncbi:MAG TPA: hypothetical protein VFZ23_06750 [Pyrinomonadaceae bacterium]